LLRRTAIPTTTARTSLVKLIHTHQISSLNTTTIPSTTATVTNTTAFATAAATLSLLPTGCFMDNQKANKVYDLAYSDEPIAPRVKEALEVIDRALDDFK
jgi:hypothetical protein